MVKETSMVSVVMATYNSERYIIEQLDSIRRQSLAVDEVIFVDDCSKDNTFRTISDYIEHHELAGWRLYRHAENQGFIQTFTDAMSYSGGDIIVLCDHDDIWLENKIQTICRAFDEHPDMLALNTKFIQIDAEGREIAVKEKKAHANNNLIRRSVCKGELNQMSFRDVAVYNISPGCTCAIRSTLRDLYMEEQHEIPHDWKLNLIAACRNGLYYLDLPTTKYRIYNANTIGLGHQKDLPIRQMIAGKNCIEKKEAARITERYLGADSEEYAYAKQIELLYLQRYEFLVKGSWRLWTRTLLRSFRFNRLYETILMDAVSRILPLRGNITGSDRSA